MNFHSNSPQSWSNIRLKFLIQDCQNGAWGKEQGEDEEDIICVRVTDFNWKNFCVSLDNPTIRSFSKRKISKLLLIKGDILIEKSGGGVKTPVGRAIYFEGNEVAIPSNFISRIRPISAVKGKFLYYVLVSQYMTGYSKQFIKQNTGIQNLDDFLWFSKKVSLPNTRIQKKIADFLDQEVKCIDNLIQKKKVFINTLSKKLQHRIDSVALFTEGEKIRLRFFLEINPGKSEISCMDGSTEITFLPMEAISNGIGGINSLAQTKKLEEVAGSYTYFSEGDILLAKVTPCFENGKKAHAIGLENQIGFGTSELHVIRIKNDIIPQYLLFVLSTSQFKSEGCISMTGAGGLKRVSENAILNFSLCLPTLEQQLDICKDITSEVHLVSRIIDKTTQSIDRLNELKISLITEAVTGQLDIEQWKQRGSAEKQLNRIEEAA